MKCKLILITTGNNAVRAYVTQTEDAIVLDWQDYPDKAMFLDQLDMVLSQHPRSMLVTYKCPYILPTDVFSKSSEGAFNIHPSLLPKFKGLNPWEHILASGETENGVTVHRMTPTADSGPILCQKAYPTPPGMTLAEMKKAADEMAADLLKTVILNHNQQ